MTITNQDMMQITEDTPPDMLTGAMDLTVHLPSGKTVKMSVERSTPMMDVLVLITTRYNLQVSRYAIEALGMAPSNPTAPNYSDKVLPYRPNTPLGALDTQHIRIVPKLKAAPPPRPVKVTGHQPFESTFRLKVHLPKNQLYVIRVSRHIYLEAIMTKVCDDKNLDSRKYEFRHPGNLDQILESKLTLSDYQITEIYLVVRGTLTAFSTNDIMALRREEEKKQMHTKAGGGVFNLIFKKVRNSLEYGSISSENRSVSPSHSDDSRSVTPPAVQAPIIPLNKPKDQPKPPQRKRKPAPKPPSQPTEHVAQPTTIQPSSSTEAVDVAPNTLPTTNVYHSRTSSDSSGYHEASILSDNLINNSSLPRVHQRPKSGPQEHVDLRKGGSIRGDHSKSTGNLVTLVSKSKSTMSLIATGRKKKAAPLPPPPASFSLHQQTQNESTNQSNSPVNQLEASDRDDISLPVTSHYVNKPPTDAATLSDISVITPTDFEPPKVRLRIRPPLPLPQNHFNRRPSSANSNQTINSNNDSFDGNSVSTFGEDTLDKTSLNNEEIVLNETLNVDLIAEGGSSKETVEEAVNPVLNGATVDGVSSTDNDILEEPKVRAQDNYLQAIESINIDLFTRKDKRLNNFDILRGLNSTAIRTEQNDTIIDSLIESTDLTDEPRRFKKNDQPDVPSSIGRSTKFDTLSRKRGFQIGSSLTSAETTSVSSLSATNDIASSIADSVSLHSAHSQSTLPSDGAEEDDLKDVNVSLFSVDIGSLALRKNKAKLMKRSSRNELYGIHDSFGEMNSSQSVSSMDGIPGFKGIKKWNNLSSLDGISLLSSVTNGTADWVIGDGSDSDNILSGAQSSIAATESNISSLSTHHDHTKDTDKKSQENPINAKNAQTCQNEVVDWKYELPLPPTAFRDTTEHDNLTQYDTMTLVSERFRGDSVASNPALFEKLNKLKEAQSDTTTTESVASTEDDDNKSVYNKLSLELLQKRKSLVYNRELATSLKSPEEPVNALFKLQDATKQNKPKPIDILNKRQTSGLPNFKITTYDEPKSKINIYEDDTISSNQATINNTTSHDLTYKTRSLMRNYHHHQDVQATYTPVVRSGSFSINTWSSANPLKRSTSQAALIHRRNDHDEEEEKESPKAMVGMSSDVAGGLQSLGVMKLIRNSLQSPTVDAVDSKLIVHEMNNIYTTNCNTLPTSNKTTKTTVSSNRWSPPALTLGTWSDRPKTRVIVKRDSDYKFKSIDILSSGINSNTNGVVVINNNNESLGQNEHRPSTLISNHNYEDSLFVSKQKPQIPGVTHHNNVSIKINGSEPISASNDEVGNVTIRIGSTNNTQPDFTTPANSQITYRKPFGNVNARQTSRPHSMAFDTHCDVSRRPVVTSATLKKSVTQINNNYTCARPNSVYLLNSNHTNYSHNNRTANRKSWHALLNRGALLSSKDQTSVSNNDIDSNYNTNVNVPFSQLRLKRTDLNKILMQPTANGTEMGFGRVLDRVPSSVNGVKVDRRHQNGTASGYCPPPPPQMPNSKIVLKTRRQQTNSSEDPRAALLSAIQNFGGKKGLRSART